MAKLEWTLTYVRVLVDEEILKTVQDLTEFVESNRFLFGNVHLILDFGEHSMQHDIDE